MAKHNKGKGKGFLNKWSAEVARKIDKVPMIIMYIIAAISMMAQGLSIMKYNENAADLMAKGFSKSLFLSFILIQLCMLLSDRLNVIVMRSITMKIINNEYIKIFERILSSKIHNILKVSTGKIFDASKTIASCKTNRVSYLFNIIPCIIPFAGLIIKEWKYNPALAIVSVVGTALGGVSIRVIEKLFSWSKDAAAIKGEMQSITVDNFMNIPTIKYSNRERWALLRLKNIQDEAFPYCVNVGKHLMYIVCMSFMWAPTIINVYLSRNSLEMLAYVVLSDYVMNKMSNQVMAIMDNEIEIHSNEKIIDACKGDDIKPVDVLETSMDLSNIVFSYEADEKDMEHETTIFRVGEDISIDKGDIMLVKGETGAGKSTLLNAIAGLLLLVEGHINSVKTFYSWQESCLFNTTLRENITSILPEDATEEDKIDLMNQADQLATRLNLNDLLNKLPNGWDTFIGEKGYRLSSGQKQRFLLIIICLYMTIHPDHVYLLDEITSNLDDETRGIAIEVLNEYMQGKTCVIVSHNPGFEDYCNKFIEVSDDHTFKRV